MCRTSKENYNSLRVYIIGTCTIAVQEFENSTLSHFHIMAVKNIKELVDFDG